MKNIVNALLGRAGYQVRLHKVRHAKPSRRIAFIHVPKCAGVAVGDAIRRQIGNSEDPCVDSAAARQAARLLIGGADPERFAEATPAYRRYLLAYHLYSQRQFVSGHLPVDTRLLEQFRDEVAFVTVLRDPIERWKSHYLFDKLRNRDPLSRPCRDCELGLEDELHEILSSLPGRLLAHVPTMILAGRFPRDPADALELADQVKHNIGLFTVVGFTDAMDRFAADFKTAFGIDVDVGRKNETRAGLDAEEERIYEELKALLGRPDMDAAIRELCATELESYRFARERFASPEEHPSVSSSSE